MVLLRKNPSNQLKIYISILENCLVPSVHHPRFSGSKIWALTTSIFKKVTPLPTSPLKPENGFDCRTSSTCPGQQYSPTCTRSRMSGPSSIRKCTGPKFRTSKIGGPLVREWNHKPEATFCNHSHSMHSRVLKCSTAVGSYF